MRERGDQYPNSTFTHLTDLNTATDALWNRLLLFRSEERRVGKECRSRWTRYISVTGVQTCALPI